MKTRFARSPLLITVIALSVLFVAIFGWRKLRNPPAAHYEAPPTAVAALQVEARSVPATLQVVGSLQAVQQVMLASETAGRIVAIQFDAGGRTKAGATLVKLDDTPEQADVAAARARADFSRLQLARSQELAGSGAEPRERLQQRQAELDQASAAVRQLEARIGQKTVRAPFAGNLGIRRVNLGQYVNPGDAMVTLTNVDQLYVNFTIPQQEVSRIRVGGKVEVAVDAWPNRHFTGRVNAIEPMIGSDTRNVSVQALLPNPDRLLQPGMYVTARLSLPADDNAIIVPATAVQTAASGDSVIAIRGPNAISGGTAEIVPVQTGRRVGDSVVIANGLKAGDVIVSEGQIRVQPGAKVTVTKKVS